MRIVLLSLEEAKQVFNIVHVFDLKIGERLIEPMKNIIFIG